ncbi:Het-C-domain-containing protein [Pseudovirgaria hyperparasitica]|uniref:Het-C-domain-containing protein n=1 Tax=Pseudovirgaria hyperparasitica TaxID=470096 RepID=A0A6A6WJW1_9PEZI|nr:Het-C-domain-containing protein [Pseudovirgaria hyperparasitica]KAF2761801.1 Het-C-domain-containing protein [Pseudovirgaria hyperparasitica]
MALSNTHLLLLVITILVLLPAPAAAFGAGNIASLSKVEGHNWRHGDIEDVLATIAFLKGRKWTSMQIKRTYFGNWLRDYSQAVDVGTLKGVQAETIRVLVWVLAFMSFGYATGEFEVTAQRLGVYRPEEHIDNPKDYADNVDARQYDQRLRGPVSPQELAVDPHTGMKNYIANEQGGWATSVGYIKFSLARSIHFGRMYTSSRQKGKEEDLCEALRCLGQGLHCLEDFGAHTNYTELALRELGYDNVFPHTGSATQINLRGKYVFPLVTGTFGGVDFLHSVLGEATDHVTQSELDEMNSTLGNASSSGKKGSGGDTSAQDLVSLLSKIPGTSTLCDEAFQLQTLSEQQAAANGHHGSRGFDGTSSSRDGPSQSQGTPSFQAPPGSMGGPPGPDIPGTNMDPAQIIPKIYPILEFRDKVVRAISTVISKIPGLEKLIDNISERVTLFIFGLLAPYIQPLIKAASKSLKEGSSTVVDASAKQQYGVWNDPHSTDPTHSMLSKDHFSNVLNSPAGEVAAQIVKYVAPRVVYAWENPNIPVDQVVDDVARVFHHPAIRDENIEIHRNMFRVVEKFARKSHSFNINDVLSSQSVRDGKNHQGGNPHLTGSGAGASHSHAPQSSHHQGYDGTATGHNHSSSTSSSATHGSHQDPFSTLANGLSSALPFKLPSSQLSRFDIFASSRELEPLNDGFGSRPASAFDNHSSSPFNPYPAAAYDGPPNEPYSTPMAYQPEQSSYGQDMYYQAPPFTQGYNNNNNNNNNYYDAGRQSRQSYYDPGGRQSSQSYYDGGRQSSQSYYDHAAAPPQLAEEYANRYQTSYQTGYYDGGGGGGLSQGPPLQPPGPPPQGGGYVQGQGQQGQGEESDIGWFR